MIVEVFFLCLWTRVRFPASPVLYIFRDFLTMKHMVSWNFQRTLLAGLLYGIFAQIIHSVSAFLSMDFYTAEKYRHLWSPIMMSEAGPPPKEFFILSIFFSIVVGILFSLVYSIIKPALFGNHSWEKGFSFGVLLFLLGSIPGYFAMVLLLAVPYTLVWIWAAESLVISLVGGMIVAKVNA